MNEVFVLQLIVPRLQIHRRPFSAYDDADDDEASAASQDALDAVEIMQTHLYTLPQTKYVVDQKIIFEQ